jgi:hypothetical protein
MPDYPPKIRDFLVRSRRNDCGTALGLAILLEIVVQATKTIKIRAEDSFRDLAMTGSDASAHPQPSLPAGLRVP